MTDCLRASTFLSSSFNELNVLFSVYQLACTPRCMLWLLQSSETWPGSIPPLLTL